MKQCYVYLARVRGALARRNLLKRPTQSEVEEGPKEAQITKTDCCETDGRVGHKISREGDKKSTIQPTRREEGSNLSGPGKTKKVIDC